MITIANADYRLLVDALPRILALYRPARDDNRAINDHRRMTQLAAKLRRKHDKTTQNNQQQ